MRTRIAAVPTATSVSTATTAPTQTPSPLPPTELPQPTNTKKITTCPGAPKQRLEPSEDAKVCTKTDFVYLRSGPAKSYGVLKKVYPGALVTVVGGPRCADQWTWWKIELGDGTTGWMAEGGDRVDPYFLCPN